MNLTRRQRFYALGGIVAVAAGAVVLAIALSGGSAKNETVPVTTTQPVSFLRGIPQHGATLGRADAPATLYVYEDPQCPFCRDWSLGALQSVVDTFVKTGRVKLVWQGIAIIGENSVVGLRAAYAAGVQNRLWNLVDELYQRQGAENSGWITDAVVRDAAAAAGADGDAILKAGGDDAVTAKLTAAARAAQSAGIQGTPSFVLVRPLQAPKQLYVTSLEPASFDETLAAALR